MQTVIFTTTAEATFEQISSTQSCSQFLLCLVDQMNCFTTQHRIDYPQLLLAINIISDCSSSLTMKEGRALLIK
ncbi:Uncharacterised protein [BD1-7 clade bacterium]|nr:Uncharacterised protein [BD1-7 clade bacterium]